MDFVLNLFMIFFTILELKNCHSWIPEYNTFFDPIGLFNVIEYPQNPPPPYYSLGYETTQLHHDNSLLYAKIYENQAHAYSIISSLEKNLPCELQYSRLSSCDKALPKQLYFADYPHVKALAQHQWKRLKNFLQLNKLGSLRINSPFYRP